MDRESIRKVAKIMTYADGGCSYCVSNFLRYLYKEWPEYVDAIDEAWVEDGYDSMTWMKD